MTDKSPDHALDVRLLKEFQQNFPICPAPFSVVAGRLGVAENTVLGGLERLRREGRIAKVGAVFAPKRIGVSTLAAMAVPADKLELVVRTINRFPEVNHTYQREHRYNLWFVVTAGSDGRLQAALGAIEQAAGHRVVAMPMLREFGKDKAANGSGDVAVARQCSGLDEIGRRLVMALQEGLPLFIRPFSILASRVGCDENELIERIRRWAADGVIKRFGVLVRDAGDSVDGEAAAGNVSALLVLNVPDAMIAQYGERLAAEPAVSLCCERARALPEWPYNLYCVLRGPSRDDLRQTIADLRERLGLASLASDVLFSLA